MESLDINDDDGPSLSPAVLRDWREIASEAIEREEVRRMLQNAVENLPAIYREVFLLRDVKEMNISETAAALAISTSSV